jgi:hypothetical protein
MLFFAAATTGMFIGQGKSISGNDIRPMRFMYKKANMVLCRRDEGSPVSVLRKKKF